VAAGTFGGWNEFRIEARQRKRRGIAAGRPKHLTEGRMETAELRLRRWLIVAVPRIAVGPTVLDVPCQTVVSVPDGMGERGLLRDEQQRSQNQPEVYGPDRHR
jgi:hypothetical protein